MTLLEDPKLFDKLLRLPNQQLHLLYLMAAAYEALPMGNIVHMIRWLPADLQSVMPNNLLQGEKALKALVKAGYLKKVGAQKYRIQPDLSWFVLQKMLEGAEEVKPFAEAVRRNRSSRSYYGEINWQLNVREMQLALMSRDGEEFIRRLDLLQLLDNQDPEGRNFDPLSYFFDRPFQASFLASFSAVFQFEIMHRLLAQKIDQLQDVQPYQEYLDIIWQQIGDSRQRQRIHQLKVAVWTSMGHVAKAREVLQTVVPSPDPGLSALHEGVLCLIEGNHPKALENFNLASRRLKARGYFPDQREGIFHALLLLWEKDFARVSAYARRRSPFFDLFELIEAMGYFMQNQEDLIKPLLNYQGTTSPSYLLVYSLAYLWTDTPLPPTLQAALRSGLENAIEHDYPFFAREYKALLLRAGVTLSPALLRQADKAAAPAGHAAFVDRLDIAEPWQRALDVMLSLQADGGLPEAQANSRIVWLVDFTSNLIQPIEQKLRKQGGWTKGRNVALKRLYQNEVENLSSQDHRIRAAIREENYGYYSGVGYEFQTDKAWLAMVGHPLLFLLSNPNIPVELVEIKPELIVTEEGNTFELSLVPEVPGAGVHLIRETNTRYQVLAVSSTQWEFFRLFSQGKLRIPRKAKEQLAKALAHIAPVLPVQSEAVGVQVDLPEVVASARPHALLMPVGDGFKVELFAKPFETAPPYLKPGEGRKLLIAEVDGQRVRTRRDLAAEQAQTAAVEAACPTLQAYPSYRLEWQLDDAEAALNLLTELLPLRESGQLVVEWPKGEKLRLAGVANTTQLALKIKAKQDWFAVEGEVQVAEGQVMALQDLLRRMQETPNSRFIALQDGQYLALTQKLRQHLMELQSLLTQRKDGMRLHQLAGGALEDLAEAGAKLKTDAAWRRRQAHIREARTLTPVVPPDFQADLRPYQEEGFRWMGRLAHWGVGACLADDMGLGKTVQALAVLLDRAKLGPALVVAPASVARNWLREAERFTPSLRPFLLHEGNRTEIIAGLGPYDLLIASYTLLQIEQEGLISVPFATVILDEAQAIKNRQTKRSQAAKSLQAGFRLLTTGTPIENHLGELWNLFDFLNPGLLGSLDQFNERFANPIERNQDHEKRQHLRKLLRPFILRRRKSEVLDELPEKTEITLMVSLSADERAFYEALRREAMARLEQESADPRQAGGRHLRILAEITRLRQACCHPQLVLPESTLSSSKLEVFAETVNELRENGHKALVFSQFVKHLRLIEAWVADQGIPYQYLDGQTPLKEREKRVEAFQRGEGDLFLISLKAGGTGLNLTAADYVIHLDPWWNPAVEDQASDRAHRIGQQRPVTVYRLVTEQTIEEKIVRMHAEKRELADSLLEGTDTGGKLDAEALLSLLQEI